MKVLFLFSLLFPFFAQGTQAKLSCKVQQVKQAPYEVVAETEAFFPEDLPKDKHGLNTMKLSHQFTLSFWSFDTFEISQGESKRWISRFTYSIEAVNGSWANNTVTIDPKYAVEPGAMRFSDGDGSYVNLVCEVK